MTPILTYHRVLAPETDDRREFYTISPHDLERHVHALKVLGYRFLTLEEASGKEERRGETLAAKV